MPPSLLDRLLPRNWPGRRTFEDQLREDIERLLNTRNHHADEWEEEFPDVASSILAYGLSDADDCMLTSAKEITALRDRVARAVRRFEPRLVDPQVRIIEAPRKFTQEVVLEIRASVRLTGEDVLWSSTLHGGRVRVIDTR